MALEEARRSGAVANFGDRYGEVVRVVTIGDFSKELCGGTHVPSGASIGTITIVREESIGANTRRVEALTGGEAYRRVAHERLVAEEIARLLDAPLDQAVERVRSLLERLKAADKELAKVRSATLAQEAKAIADAAAREDGLAVVVRAVEGVDMDDLRRLATEVRGHLGTRAIVVLGTATADGKAQLICAVSADLAERAWRPGRSCTRPPSSSAAVPAARATSRRPAAGTGHGWPRRSRSPPTRRARPGGSSEPPRGARRGAAVAGTAAGHRPRRGPDRAGPVGPDPDDRLARGDPARPARTGPADAGRAGRRGRAARGLGVVIGEPRRLDGRQGAGAARARRFADELAARTDLPVLLWDERFTTAEAERVLLEGDVSRATGRGSSTSSPRACCCRRS
jgi:hypothetical protein